MTQNLLGQDIRELFALAHRYLEKKSSVHELNGAIGKCLVLAKTTKANPEIIELLQEWGQMVNRRWNEWGLEKHSLSEDEFSTWLREQLVVHDHAR